MTTLDPSAGRDHRAPGARNDKAAGNETCRFAFRLLINGGADGAQRSDTLSAQLHRKLRRSATLILFALILVRVTLFRLILFLIRRTTLPRRLVAGLRGFRIIDVVGLVVGVHLGPSINPLRDTLRMIWI